MIIIMPVLATWSLTTVKTKDENGSGQNVDFIYWMWLGMDRCISLKSIIEFIVKWKVFLLIFAVFDVTYAPLTGVINYVFCI